jgi:hypothetical protein
MSEHMPESLPSSPEDEARRLVEYEATLGEALDNTPRSAELRELRDVLSRRQSALQRDYDSSTDADERKHLEERLNELEEQIGILDEEAKIYRLVEETV